MANVNIKLILLFKILTGILTCEAFMCSEPIDCQDIQDGLRINRTGIYTIFPPGTYGFKVRCDMNTTSGGWTVIQRRVSNSTDFYRTWNEYQAGFGDLNGNFWLGNQHMNKITSHARYKLRIDMTHSNGTSAYTEYDGFRVGNLQSKYQLTVNNYHGNAGDALTRHNGSKFSTKDSDNDGTGINCAVSYLGGWWYADCHSSNLNGAYGNTNYGQGITWFSFTGYYTSLSFVEMKIKRLA